MKKRYDQVKTTELEIGDVFTNEIKINNRESFEVIEVENNGVKVRSRKTFVEKTIYYSARQKHIFLRRVEE